MEGNARAGIVDCQDATAMGVNDGAGNGQPKPHAMRLGCVEGIEQVPQLLPGYPGALIRYCDMYLFMG